MKKGIWRIQLEKLQNGVVDLEDMTTGISIMDLGLIPSLDDLPVADKLKKQDIILKQEKDIGKLERLSRGEKQPKKRFEMFTKLQELKKKLAEEKGE